MLFGLIGKSLRHSFSAEFFNNKFREEGIDASYRNFEIPSIEYLSEIIDSNTDLYGLNVTIPYKRDIIPMLTSISERAAKIGAVNTVVIEREDIETRLHGYNTDSPGFKESLLKLIPADTKIENALILGTGGASAAIANALFELGIGYTFVSRRSDHKQNRIGYHELSQDIIERHRLIINTTPLGTFPKTDEAPDLPYHLLTPKHICHDIVYNPSITRFMTLCAAQGALVKNGYEMLINQALLSWDYFRSSAFR